MKKKEKVELLYPNEEGPDSNYYDDDIEEDDYYEDEISGVKAEGESDDYYDEADCEEDDYYEDEEDCEADDYYEGEEACEADDCYEGEEVYESDDSYEDEIREEKEEGYYGKRRHNDDMQRKKNTGNKTRSCRKQTIKGSKKPNVMDVAATAAGVLILVLAVVIGGVYAGKKTAAEPAVSFAAIGRQMEEITVIGESGLFAMTDARKGEEVLQEAVEESSEVKEYEEKEFRAGKSVQVELHLNSMQRDLKIKFTNEETGKLIPNVQFEVEVTPADGKGYVLKDEDMDGIIYQADVVSGECLVAMKELPEAENYLISTESTNVTIKDKIEYKKVDVADEIKTEAEVNAAIEDTKRQDTAVESELTDTVGFTESTKTLAEEASEPEESGEPEEDIEQENDAEYEEVAKENITAPFTVPEAGSTSDKVFLDHSALKLKIGESFTLRAAVSPEGNAGTWGSSNEGVVTVQDGSVTAVAAGTADITVTTAAGNSAVCNVTVIEQEAQAVTIGISQPSVRVNAGQTVQIGAEVKGNEDRGVVWSSSNEAVAVIAMDGTITGISAGTVNITAASSADGSVTAFCEVTVLAAPEQDTISKLKDKDGSQLFVALAEGGWREAVYADYDTADKFYKKKQTETTGETTESEDAAGETQTGEATQTPEGTEEYKYTGWQTIDGKTYYFDAEGNKVTGEQVIQGAKYIFDSEGVLSTSSGNMGIDVSKWNGNIDWNAVKNSGVSYVIIRCGYRGSTTGALIEDPMFRANIQGAASAGLKVGIYFFTQAVNEAEAVEEASMVAGLINGYHISYPVFLDVEPSGGRADGLDKATRTAVCRAFCQTIQNSGYTAGIYANNTWLTERMDAGSLTDYKIWLAQYAAVPTYAASRYDLWQYSAKGTVAGIEGSVDMNISYLGY